MRKLLSALLIVSIAASAITFSACGQKNTNTTSSKTPDTSAARVSRPSRVSEEPIEVSVDEKKPHMTEAQLADLNKKVTDCQGIPSFTCTSEKLDGRKISKDLTVSLICDNSSSPFQEDLIRNFVRTADRIGFKHIITAETDGTASTMNDALTQAVKDKPNMVMLSGNINKDTVVTNIELAQANGIEVVSAGTTGCEQPDHFVDYTVPIPYENAGALMADWGIVKTKGKVNALVVNCTDSELSQTIFRGFKKEFEQYVSADDGNCTVINANAIELGNGLTNKIKTILENDRKINYIFVFDDAAITDAVSSVVQTSSSAKIVATGGKPEDFNYAQSGSIDMLVY